jgi:YAP binding domain
MYLPHTQYGALNIASDFDDILPALLCCMCVTICDCSEIICANCVEHCHNFYFEPFVAFQSVDIRQIADKFPDKNGGLRELYDKGPQSAFFLVKFWVCGLVFFVLESVVIIQCCQVLCLW